MEIQHAADCLEALGNATRLSIFRLLVQSGHDGTPVGDLQRHLDIPASTLSHHLARLMRHGLVSQERRGRMLICRAEYDAMDELLDFMQNNCCGGIGMPPSPA